LREIPTAQRGNFILEKRPTIEALDKRKSWSVSPGRPLMAGRHSAPVSYKKPVPLPRLKPKVTAPPHGIVRLGKRSKTDLTLEGLSAYKQRPEKPLTLSTFDDRTTAPLKGPLREQPCSGLRRRHLSQKSQPLVIMTQPIKDVEKGLGQGDSHPAWSLQKKPRKALPSIVVLTSPPPWKRTRDLSVNERESSRLLGDLSPELKSPVSTTSRSPPSPSPDMTPTRS
ncbi:Rho GTPaseactivating protein 12like, partial [Caligus rogercresseyi]